jgi:hypothetical protein
MTSSAHTLPSGNNHQRPLGARPAWAAVAVLGVSAVSLGASLIHVQTRPADGHAVFATADPLQEFAAAQAGDAPAPVAATTFTPGNTSVPPRPKPRAGAAASTAPASTAPALASRDGSEAPTQVATAGSQAESAPPAVALAPPAPFVVTESGVVHAPASADAPLPRVVCAGCGRVESVTPIVADNSSTIVYLVLVRMDDGRMHRLQHTTAPEPGTMVIVDGPSLRSAEGAPALSSGSEQHAPTAAAPGAKVYGTQRH